jgi:8-oxo-dGTP diphosphatase
MDIAAAGGIVFDDQGRLLLIRRGRPPGAGSWSVPGGRSEPDELAAAACVRELAEETGLIVEVLRHAGRVWRPAGVADRFVIDDFVCRIAGGRLRAGDDASAAGWFDRSDLARLPLVDGLLAALDDWNLQPD